MKKLSSGSTNLTGRTESGSSDSRKDTDTTLATSIVSTNNHRWSEIVPPKSALAFAVIWDADDEIATFSGAELFDLPEDDVKSVDSPSDTHDNLSQVLDIGTSTIPVSENTATLAFLRDNYRFFSMQTPTFSEDQRGNTRTSSTFGGLDVYVSGSLLRKAHKSYRCFSCLDRLDGGFEFDPRTSFANMWLKQTSLQDTGNHSVNADLNGVMENETTCAGANLRSAFSTSTTSTSNYVLVEVEDEDDDDGSWSILEAPNSPNFENQFKDQKSSSSRNIWKRKKGRPAEIPVLQSEVLQREAEHSPLQPSSCSLARLLNFVRRGKCKKASSKDQWVCVEVTQKITQHYV